MSGAPERPDRSVTMDWLMHLFSRFKFQAQGPFVSLTEVPVANEMLPFVFFVSFTCKMFAEKLCKTHRCVWSGTAELPGVLNNWKHQGSRRRNELNVSVFILVI